MVYVRYIYTMYIMYTSRIKYTRAQTVYTRVHIQRHVYIRRGVCFVGIGFDEG